MQSLSLSPRYDLFRFNLPKDFIPADLNEKYTRFLAKEKNIITNPIDYLNESLIGISTPGLESLTTEQSQHSQHGPRLKTVGDQITAEPERKNVEYTSKNPLSLVEQSVTLSFRMNQGLLNYWMMYEIIFHKIMKEKMDSVSPDDLFQLDLLDENGTRMAVLSFDQPHIDGLSGLQFSFNKTERQSETFELTIKYNNFDLDFISD